MVGPARTSKSDGAYGGAGARHAPDAEGLIMTDVPKDYGLFVCVYSLKWRGRFFQECGVLLVQVRR